MIKAEYINPIIDAAVNVLEMVIQVRPETGKLSLSPIKVASDHIHVQIGLMGQLEGSIVVGLLEPVAKKIVSQMMGGFEITVLDEIGKSAICELGNMIGGSACTNFSSEAIRVDISPPVVLEQGSAADSLTSHPVLMIPLLLNTIGELDLYVVTN